MSYALGVPSLRLMSHLLRSLAAAVFLKLRDFVDLYKKNLADFERKKTEGQRQQQGAGEGGKEGEKGGDKKAAARTKSFKKPSDPKPLNQSPLGPGSGTDRGAPGGGGGGEERSQKGSEGEQKPAPPGVGAGAGVGVGVKKVPSYKPQTAMEKAGASLGVAAAMKARLQNKKPSMFDDDEEDEEDDF